MPSSTTSSTNRSTGTSSKSTKGRAAAKSGSGGAKQGATSRSGSATKKAGAKASAVKRAAADAAGKPARSRSGTARSSGKRPNATKATVKRSAGKRSTGARRATVKAPAPKSSDRTDEETEQPEGPVAVLLDREDAAIDIRPPASEAAPTGARSLVQLLGRDRQGGVAPFVPPAGRGRRAFIRRRFERRGFVPLSPGRPKWHHRILPRSVIGISFMLLSCGVGAAFSGAAFYAYYDKRLAENEETVARFVEGFDEQFTDATGAIDSLRGQAIDDIRTELSPLGDYVDDANGVVLLPSAAGGSIWHLETRGEDGEPVRGAAFAIARHDGGTAFVTSHSLILSSVTAPNPSIELIKDDRRLSAQLWTWDEGFDVAVLVVEDDEIPLLDLASSREQLSSIGARLFALSGLGGQGATASPGVLLDQSQSGLQHTAPVGSLFVGGPLLTGSGKVVGLSTLAYQPHGIDPGRVLSAPDVAGLCASVLACAEENAQVFIELSVEEPEGARAPALEPLPTDEVDEDAEGTEDN